MGLLPRRTLSTAQRPKPQQPPSSPTASTTRRGPFFRRDGNNDDPRNGSQRKKKYVDGTPLCQDFAAKYLDLKSRSKHLEDVARGIVVVDKFVRMADYRTALEMWKELACQCGGGNGTGENEQGKASSSSSGSGLAAARGARSLLEALEHTANTTSSSTTLWSPTVSLYNLVLQAYAGCDGGVVAATEAQPILERMLEKARGVALEDLSPRLTPKYPEPNVASYNIVISCWARANCRDSGNRAEKVFSLMEEWRNDCQMALQRDLSFPYRGCYPTTITVNALMNAWSWGTDLQAPDRAWQLLQDVVEDQRNPSKSGHRFRDAILEPRLLNAVIMMWTRSRRGRDAAAKAEEILSLAGTLKAEGLMEESPCKRTYALVLDAWSKSENSTGECAQRAHDLLFKMIRLYRQGAPIELNAVAFCTCIAAWSRCATLKDAPEKAEAILQELLSLHEETDLVDFYPDFRVWNSLQAVWFLATERTESMDRCAEVIQRMQKYGCQPSIALYCRVVQAAIQRGLVDQAQSLLQQLTLDSNILLHRNVRIFNCVLEALAWESRDDAMDRAMAFLEKMKSQDVYAKPDSFSYTILLDALSRSKGPRHAERGRGLLEEMMQRFQQGDESCRPHARVVSLVVKLCANTSGTDDDRRRALDIALETVRKCESYYGVLPDYCAYSALLHATDRLTATEDQRLELLQKVFEECRALGLVSAAAVRIMRRGGASHCLTGLTAFSSLQVPHHDRPDIRRRRVSKKQIHPDGSSDTASRGSQPS